MNKKRITIEEAIKFHGHLGPYLVLGILAGEFALKKIGCQKYFGLNIRVWGANRKPKSCLIDGLQLATGATYGKGNIEKLNGSAIKIEFCNLKNNKKIILSFRDKVAQKLKKTKTHSDAIWLARRLYKTSSPELFNLTTTDY